MKRAAKIWLAAAAALVLAGCILFAGTMSVLGWDFAKLSTVSLETNTHEISEVFKNISVTTNNTDIEIIRSDDGKCRVVCSEEENAKHSVTAVNGTLTVEINEKKSWYDYIGFYFVSPKITIYLPEKKYGTLSVHAGDGSAEIPKDLTFESADISLSTGNIDFFASAQKAVKIKTTAGNIFIKDTAADSLDLSVTTGSVTASGVTCAGDIAVGVSTGEADLTDISCKSFISDGATGSIALNNVIAENRVSVKRSTGDVKFSGCDAEKLYVKTGTGNVRGSLLTDKVFITDTDTGSVDVPKTAAGGRCEIKTGTGDIKMEIK